MRCESYACAPYETLGKYTPPHISTTAKLVHHQQILASERPYHQHSKSTTQLPPRTLPLHLLHPLPLGDRPHRLRHWDERTAKPSQANQAFSPSSAQTRSASCLKLRERCINASTTARSKTVRGLGSSMGGIPLVMVDGFLACSL